MRLTDRRLFAALLLLCVVVISRGSPAMSGDAAYYLAIGDSILRDGDLNLRNQYSAQGGFIFQHALDTSFARPGKGSALYPSQGLGWGVLIAPVSWVAQTISGALPESFLAKARWTPDRAARDLISLAMALVAAWLLLLSVRLTERLAGPGTMRWPLLLAFATPPLIFAAIYPGPETLAALLIVVFALEMVAAETGRGLPPPGRRNLAALALAMLPWLHGRFAFVAIAGAIWLARRRGWRTTWPVIASFVLLIGVTVMLFGKALPPPIPDTPRFSVERWILSWPQGLFSADYGLLWIAPFWLIAAGGVSRIRAAAPGLVGFAGSAVMALLVMGSAFDDSRPSQIAGMMLAPALPLLGPALAVALSSIVSRWRMAVSYALIAWTLTYASMVIARPRRLLAGEGEGLGTLPFQLVHDYRQRNSPARQLERLGRTVDEPGLIQSATAGDVTATQLYLEAGVGGGGALVEAAKRGQTATLEILLARVGVNTFTAARALALARAAGQSAAATALQNAGVTIDAADPSGDTALMSAIRDHREDEWDLLIKQGANVNARTRTGETAVMFAVMAGDYPAALVLIGAGADVNAADNDGWTALMFAARFGRLSHASGLIRAGANVNAASRLGWTPLMWAAYAGNEPMATMLLDAGANPNASSRAAQTALIRAEAQGNARMTELLRSRGAQR